MTINYHYSMNDDDGNENLDEVLGNLYAIADERYQVMLEHGFGRASVEYYLKITKDIGYLEQVRASQKKCSKTKKRKENPENS